MEPRSLPTRFPPRLLLPHRARTRRASPPLCEENQRRWLKARIHFSFFVPLPLFVTSPPTSNSSTSLKRLTIPPTPRCTKNFITIKPLDKHLPSFFCGTQRRGVRGVMRKPAVSFPRKLYTESETAGERFYPGRDTQANPGTLTTPSVSLDTSHRVTHRA